MNYFIKTFRLRRHQHSPFLSHRLQFNPLSLHLSLFTLTHSVPVTPPHVCVFYISSHLSVPLPPPLLLSLWQTQLIMKLPRLLLPLRIDSSAKVCVEIKHVLNEISLVVGIYSISVAIGQNSLAQRHCCCLQTNAVVLGVRLCFGWLLEVTSVSQSEQRIHSGHGVYEKR